MSDPIEAAAVDLIRRTRATPGYWPKIKLITTLRELVLTLARDAEIPHKKPHEKTAA